MRTIVIVITMWIVCASNQVDAATAEVRAFVDRNRVAVGESIRLTVSLTGGSGDVDLSPIKDFRVVSRGTSTSVQIINGRTTREVRYAYVLIPLKEGRLLIPALKVSSGRQTLYTNEIPIDVSNTASSGNDSTMRDVFVASEVSESSPYIGQQFSYTFKFSHAVQVAEARFQPPEFNGFNAEEVEKRKSYRSVISGREYMTTEITYILVPLSAGEKIIEPALIQCGVVSGKKRRRDSFGSIFDDPFFGRGRVVQKILQTQPTSITARALPSYSGTGRFSGLVGRFAIRAELENDLLKAGESTTLAVTVEGEGNIMDAEPPLIQLPDAFKTYDDSPEENFTINEKGYSGRKVFRKALVPVTPGDYTLSAAQITFFDPGSGQYVTRATQPVSLTVTPADHKDNLSEYSATVDLLPSIKKSVEFTGRDILPVKEEMDAIDSIQPVSMTGFFIFLIVPAGVFGAVMLSIRFIRQDTDPVSVMARKSQEALKSASKSDITDEEFLSALYKALTAMILSNAGTTGESLTYEEARDILMAKGFSEESCDRAVMLLQSIESAKYSGADHLRMSRVNMLDEVREFVRELAA